MDIGLQTLQANGTRIKLSGNILTLLLCIVDSDPVEPGDTSTPAWVWDGTYLKTTSSVPGHETMTEKIIEVTTLGSLIEPINPSVVEASAYLPMEKMAQVNSRGITWLLEEDIILAAIDLIWKCALKMKILPSSFTLIRIIGTASNFPYHSVHQ